MVRLFPLLIVVCLSCTNYTASPTFQIPPTLISAVSNGNSNFRLTVRATNPELIFQGYRLFSGATESEARNQADLNVGTDCSLSNAALTVLPVQPRDYIFEIDPSTSTPVAGSGIDCKFRVTLTSGTFISIRSLGLSIRTQSNTSSFRVSGPSNAIILP
jgi:hypothetical protein